MPLTPEQRNKLSSAGYSPEKISAYERQKFGTTYSEQEGGISRAFKGGIERVKEGYKEAQDPNLFKAIAGGTKIAGGLIQSATSPLAPIVEPTIGRGISAVSSKIADIPGVQKFAQTGAGKTTARAAEFAGDISAIGGTVAGGLAAPKLGGVVSKTVAPVTRGAGRTLKSLGESAYDITVVPSEATAKSVLAYNAKQPSLTARIKNIVTGEEPTGRPTTEANTAARMGLMGTEYELGVQAKQAGNRLWQQEIQPKLDKVKGSVNMKSFVDQLKKDIVKDTPELNRRTALLEAADAFSESYKNVGKINLSKLQQYKEGWAEFIPEATYKGKPIGSALREVQNLAAEKARQVIYQYVGEKGRQAYIDYGNLQSIIKAGVKSTVGDPASKSITRNVWQFVMDKAVTPVVTTAGRVLYRTGEGLEFVGQKGAKTVGEVLGEKIPVQSRGRESTKIPIKIDSRTLRPKTEGKTGTKIPLYGGSTPPKGNLPTIR